MNETIKISWSVGNYLVSLTSKDEFETDGKPLSTALLERGLLHTAQRVSEVDKVLGGFELVKGKDKPQRKKGWRRIDAPYDASVGAKLADCFRELEVKDGVVVECDVEITQYVPSTGDAKFEQEREIVGRKESAGTLETWLADVVGYKGETHTADGEDYLPAMLVAVRTWKVAYVKAQLDALK